MSRSGRWRGIGAGLSVLVLAGTTGCPVVSNREAPGRELTERDSYFGRPYYLYVPTQYRETGETRLWPVVVTCHGTPPWDTARLQFDEWKGLAEQKGFLLVAPELVGTRGDVVPPPAGQIEKQIEDEKAILAIVRAVQAARSVDTSRIFLTGWSAGGYAVLFTGLRHPDVFRALSVRQGNFDAAFVEPCAPFLDRYQPIQILYGESDLLKDQALACIDWLRGHGLEPTALGQPGIHHRSPEPVFSFFTTVVRQRPWVRVLVEDDARDPLKVRFGTRSSFEPAKFLWDFGDSQLRSPLANPEHRYARAGFYDVQLAVWAANGGPYVRQIRLQVPRVRLGVAPPASGPGQ